MEMVKKYGLWVLAGVIALAAVVVYILFVHTVTEQVNEKRGDMENRRDSLKSWSQRPTQIPSPAKIQIARKNAEQVSAMLDQCELYLARQPRWAHTIRFFMEGPFGPETEVPLDRPNDWLNLYRQYNQELQAQVLNAGMSYQVKTMDWGTSVPTPAGIGSAMELYWFQKDLIDFLTQQVEKDFAAYIDFKAKGQANPFPAKPFDLVVNHSPARLDEFLRSTSRDKLVAVLGAIVVNRQQQDLAMIFNTLLRDEKKPDGTIVYGFPWERPASDKEHGSVRGFTMDEAQEKFLAEMLPPDKPDLSDRQRFLDYVMELRMVRYRANVIGLLESHHFDSLAAALRRGTEAELNGILNDIADVNGEWNTTRIAEAISAIVSINNESDFILVRNNHAPDIAALVNLTIGGGEEAAGARGVWAPAAEPGRRRAGLRLHEQRGRGGGPAAGCAGSRGGKRRLQDSLLRYGGQAEVRAHPRLPAPAHQQQLALSRSDHRYRSDRDADPRPRHVRGADAWRPAGAAAEACRAAPSVRRRGAAASAPGRPCRRRASADSAAAGSRRRNWWRPETTSSST